MTKTDYSEEIRAILQNNYSAAQSVVTADNSTVKKTLTDIYRDIIQVLPKRWVDESDVYEALQELGFKSFLFSMPPEFNEDGEEETVEDEFLYLMEKKTATY
jgi:hypothetical protein